MLKRLSEYLGWPIERVRYGVLLIGGISLVVVAWIAFTHPFTAKQGGEPQGMPQMPVRTTPVKVIDLIITATSVGTLQSHQSVTIRPEITGRVAKIHFREGQAVKKGDVLISLDDSISRASLNQAVAELKLAERNYKRAVDLFKRGVSTGRTQDETLSQLDVSHARVELARANLSKTQLSAPFPGIVGLRQVDEGAFVQPGQDLVNLENINPIKVDFRLPETLLPELKPGLKVKISVDAFPNKLFEGSILALDPRLDAAGRNVAMRALIPNSNGSLRPGLFARVTLNIAEHKNAMMVPEESIVAEGENFYVFKAVKDHAAKAQVVLGAHKDDSVQILSGLIPGDMVITAGQEKLRDGFGIILMQDNVQPAGGK